MLINNVHFKDVVHLLPSLPHRLNGIGHTSVRVYFAHLNLHQTTGAVFRIGEQRGQLVPLLVLKAVQNGLGRIVGKFLKNICSVVGFKLLNNLNQALEINLFAEAFQLPIIEFGHHLGKSLRGQGSGNGRPVLFCNKIEQFCDISRMKKSNIGI